MKKNATLLFDDRTFNGLKAKRAKAFRLPKNHAFFSIDLKTSPGALQIEPYFGKFNPSETDECATPSFIKNQRKIKEHLVDVITVLKIWEESVHFFIDNVINDLFG